MFAKIKDIFAKRNKDLRKRILFTLVSLAIFIIGTNVRIPGTKGVTNDLGFLELLNVIGGGALKNSSIFALGVSPYINASIIVQLLAVAIPALEKLSKEGVEGRKKLSKIT